MKLKMHKEDDSHLFFEVQGAGDLQISKSSSWKTGTAEGFSIGVSWGQHGYAGGVMDMKEAEEMARHILKHCRKLKLEKLK